MLGEDNTPEVGTGHHTVLIRRNDTTGELAYHRCYSHRAVLVERGRNLAAHADDRASHR